MPHGSAMVGGAAQQRQQLGMHEPTFYAGVEEARLNGCVFPA
jgi:hypothetical protein